MAIMAVNLSALPTAVREAMHKLCTTDNAMDMVKARIRQTQLAKFMRDHPPRFKEGFGAQTMAIDPFWLSQFKMQFGTDPFHDPDFRRWLKRQGEDQYFTRSTSAKTMVGYTGPTDRNLKFSKTYTA